MTTSSAAPNLRITTRPVSDCCKADVRVAGHTTKHYECTACGQPCDVTTASAP